jgi:CheY-like chemotaxis protein
MRALILEDNPERRAAMNERLADRFSFLQVAFFDSAKQMIESMTAGALNDVAVIAIDHDLDMLPGPDGNWIDPGTGLDVASWLSKRPRPVCPVVVHTTNWNQS